MQDIEKEFNSYYLDQLKQNSSLPPFITEFFNAQACLAFSETKCIYIVSDIIFNQKYILKQVSRQHLSQSEQEWDILSSLKHPSIPKVYKRYSDDAYTYMIREYFDGMTLDAYVLENGPVQEDEAVDLAVKMCDLLLYLHNQDPPIIHRDIKPQNLVLRPDGSIGLIDFETSRRYNLQAENDTVYMGTLQTAAPEQFGYQQTNCQTDIYALGVLLIYLETGSYDRADTCHMTPRLKRIAEKCTEFSPKDRYKNVDKVKKHLLGEKNPVFSKKMIFSISAFLVVIMILFGSLTSAYLAKQARLTNYAEMENISFKNPGIEKTVRRLLGKTAGEPLSKSELGRITKLEIIGDLKTPVIYEDLQHDYNGNRIGYNGEYLKRGPVDSLEDLAFLPSLSELTLVYQQISDLSGIEKLHHPVKLSLAYNYISDLTPLKDMESLTFLRINCNPIKDLSPLKNLSRLSYLQIAGTFVDDLSPLSSIQPLTTLDIWGMKDLDLTPLNNLKNLKEIYQ